MRRESETDAFPVCCPDLTRAGQRHDCPALVVSTGGIYSVGGFRPDEFIWRLNGDSYMSILQRGGGILSTVEATRNTSVSELRAKAEHFTSVMSRMGVTTVEGKSGYGLDCDTELKQLEVMQAINFDSDRKVDIVPTFLGAHAVPKEYKGRDCYAAYSDSLLSEEERLKTYTGKVLESLSGKQRAEKKRARRDCF